MSEERAMEERDDHSVAIESVVETRSANKRTLKTHYGFEGKDASLMFSIEWHASWDGRMGLYSFKEC